MLEDNSNHSSPLQPEVIDSIQNSPPLPFLENGSQRNLSLSAINQRQMMNQDLGEQNVVQNPYSNDQSFNQFNPNAPSFSQNCPFPDNTNFSSDPNVQANIQYRSPDQVHEVSFQLVNAEQNNYESQVVQSSLSDLQPQNKEPNHLSNQNLAFNNPFENFTQNYGVQSNDNQYRPQISVANQQQERIPFIYQENPNSSGFQNHLANQNFSSNNFQNNSDFFSNDYQNNFNFPRPSNYNRNQPGKPTNNRKTKQGIQCPFQSEIKENEEFLFQNNLNNFNEFSKKSNDYNENGSNIVLSQYSNDQNLFKTNTNVLNCSPNGTSQVFSQNEKEILRSKLKESNKRQNGNFENQRECDADMNGPFHRNMGESNSSYFD